METAIATNEESCALCHKHPRYEGRRLCVECLGLGKAPPEEPHSEEARPVAEDRVVRPYLCPECGDQHAGGKVGVGITDVCQPCLSKKKQKTRDARKQGAPLPLREKAKRAKDPEQTAPPVHEPANEPTNELGTTWLDAINLHYPAVMVWLAGRAKEEVRTIRQQAIYELLRLARRAEVSAAMVERLERFADELEDEAEAQ